MENFSFFKGWVYEKRKSARENFYVLFILFLSAINFFLGHILFSSFWAAFGIRKENEILIASAFGPLFVVTYFLFKAFNKKNYFYLSKMVLVIMLQVLVLPLTLIIISYLIYN